MYDKVSVSNLLISANSRLNEFSKTDFERVPAREVQKATRSVRELLKEIKRPQIAFETFDKDAVLSLIRGINQFKRKTHLPEPEKGKRLNSKEKYHQVISELKDALSSLRKNAIVMKKKEVSHLNRDLAKLLSVVDKNTDKQGLKISKRIFTKVADVVSQSEAFSKEFYPDLDEGVIARILKKIPFLLQTNVDAQVRAGTLRVQMNSNKAENLKKLEIFLRLVLNSLKKSRGGQAAAVEKGAQ